MFCADPTLGTRQLISSAAITAAKCSRWRATEHRGPRFHEIFQLCGHHSTLSSLPVAAHDLAQEAIDRRQALSGYLDCAGAQQRRMGPCPAKWGSSASV